jgi:oligopeptide/dipeptide ABC transporter ATP-binding protein
VSPLLEVRGLRHVFGPRGRSRRPRAATVALDGVDLALEPGESLALVGESGSGKTTLARAIAGLLEPSGGTVRFRGEEWRSLPARERRRRRRHLQTIFQDPFLSLDPRMRVAETVAEPALVHGLVGRRDRLELARRRLAEVELDSEAGERFPHELSGGQRQRVAIARALACDPELVVADEPLAALDPPLRARVAGLLARLGRERGTALLWIEHDLRLAVAVAGRLAVIFAGRIVEEGEARAVVAAPRHPYTAALVAAARFATLPGTGAPAGEAAPGPGCPYSGRCPRAVDRCRVEAPVLQPREGGGRVACHRPVPPEGALVPPGWNLSEFPT